MVYTIGNKSGEIKRLPITLLSNVSSSLFPDNTATDFTNVLPDTVVKSTSIESMGMRIRAIYVSKYSEMNEDAIKRKHFEPMMIMISAIEGQRVNERTLPILTIANVREACKTNARSSLSKYCYVSFGNAPVMTVNQDMINRLRVRLITTSGKTYPLWNDALVVPTIIEIEFLSMNADREFTITCMSHGTNLLYHEYNTLTKFTSKMGSHMDFSSWEVALQSISMPPFLKRGEELTLMWNYSNEVQMPSDADDRWRTVRIIFSRKYATRKDIFEEVTRQLDADLFNQNKLDFSQDNIEQWQLKNNYENTAVHIKLNTPMCAVTGWPNYFLLNSNMPKIVDITERSEDDLVQVPELAFLYCSLSKDTIIGEQRGNLLSIVPMNAFLNDGLPDKGASLFEPKNLLFHEIESGTFININFEMKRADGKSFALLPSLPSEYNEMSGGCVISLHFRPKNKGGEEAFMQTQNELLRTKRNADPNSHMFSSKKIKYKRSYNYNI